MANLPLYIVLETLFRYSRDIKTHSLVYTKQQNVIKKEQVNDAIVFLDSRVILGNVLREVMNEDSYEQRI